MFHQNLTENKVFMDEMAKGLRFDPKTITRVGKEGESPDGTGLPWLVLVVSGQAVGTLGAVTGKEPDIRCLPFMHVWGIP
jgi:hypothetical protein